MRFASGSEKIRSLMLIKNGADLFLRGTVHIKGRVRHAAGLDKGKASTAAMRLASLHPFSYRAFLIFIP